MHVDGGVWLLRWLASRTSSTTWCGSRIFRSDRTGTVISAWLRQNASDWGSEPRELGSHLGQRRAAAVGREVKSGDGDHQPLDRNGERRRLRDLPKPAAAIVMHAIEDRARTVHLCAVILISAIAFAIVKLAA